MTIEEYLAAMRMPECDRILYCDTPEGVYAPGEDDE